MLSNERVELMRGQHLRWAVRGRGQHLRWAVRGRVLKS